MKLNAFAKIILFATALCAVAFPLAAQVQPSDVVTVGSAAGSAGSTVSIPVYIRDVSATPLGVDQPAGSRIQSLSIRVNYPAAQVQSITFDRAGITAGLTPVFENKPSAPGATTLIVTFDENTNPIPFTSNLAAPGDQIGVLNVTIAGGASPGASIPLTLDTGLTLLTNQAGSVSETVANGRLTLVNGAIAVTAPVPTLEAWGIILLAGALAFAAIRVRL